MRVYYGRRVLHLDSRLIDGVTRQLFDSDYYMDIRSPMKEETKKKISEALRKKYGSASSAVKNAFSKAKTGVTNAANRAYGHAENAFTKGKNLALEKGRAAGQSIQKGASKAGSAIRGKASKAGSAIAKGAGKAGGSIVKALATKGGKAGAIGLGLAAAAGGATLLAKKASKNKTVKKVGHAVAKPFKRTSSLYGAAFKQMSKNK